MKKIIIAPLNWGLGHATRCVPIINALIESNFTPVIASDGNALQFLKKEFPKLEALKLPAYNINYGRNLKITVLKQFPKILKIVKQEKQVIANYLKTNNNVAGIISDNRFGVRSNKVPSVYITHQINILSGWATFLTSKIHHNIIRKFDECWIPDKVNSTYSGNLSTKEKITIPTRYIGVLSRLTHKNLSKKNDILIILSGPEPNRTHLEEKLLREFKNDTRNIILVQGQIEKEQIKSIQGNITMYNYLLSKQLEQNINSSELIVCRSGYSSIMDLVALGKKVFFIPTKGQTEQEYLAKYLEKQQIAPFSNERDFKKSMLARINKYKGFEMVETEFDNKLFNLFERK